MAGDEDTLESVQEHLTLALERYRTMTRVRGDFMETVFGVHHGLLRAFNIWLRDSDFLRENEKASFKDRAKEVLPDFISDYDIPGLADQRNYYAHPQDTFYYSITDTTIQDTAKAFVELILDAWTELFDTSPPYVTIEHPEITAQENILNAPQVEVLWTELKRLKAELERSERREASLSAAAEKKDGHIEELQEQVSGLKARLRPKIPKPHLPDLPWRQLAWGLVLLPVPLLLSLALHLWATIPGAWAWPVAAGVAALVLCFFGLLNLARFLREVGLLRLVAILSVALILATLLVLPSTDAELPWAERGGTSLTVVLDAIGDGVYAYTSVCADWGGKVADAIASSPDVPTPAAKPTRSATPTATRGPRATSTATVRPTATATRTP